MAGNRGFDPARPPDGGKVEAVAGFPAGQFRVLQLRAAVPLAERVDVVDVADDDGSLLGEGGGRQPLQEAGPHEAAMDVRHAGLDEFPKLKLLPALADLDRAQLAGPVADVLKQ